MKKIQTLTNYGWKDIVVPDDKSVSAMRVYAVASDGSMRQKTIETFNILPKFDAAVHVPSGIWTGVSSSEDTLVVDSKTMHFALSKNPLQSLGRMSYPCKVKAYDIVDKNVVDSIGGADEIEKLIPAAVANCAVDPRWMRLGAVWAIKYLNRWNSHFGGMYAPDEKVAADIQALFAITGQFSTIVRGNTVRVSKIDETSFVPTMSKVIESEIQAFYDKNGIYIRAIRRDPVSGMIFVF